MPKKISILIIKFLTVLFFSQVNCAELSAEFTPLSELSENPGELTASYYMPEKMSVEKHSALVVLLHGCTQNGEQLAKQSGLLGLAKQKKFALLIPQQSLSNNIKQCFNWYSQQDTLVDAGESLSIKNMIITLQDKLQTKGVYIIGVSAGGAMTSSMLVNYPDMFVAGAVISGIPFPCADGLITAISCMKNGPSQTVDELTAQVSDLKTKQVVWPRLSIWTGTEDVIVNPLNAVYLAQQWAKLSGLSSKAKESEMPGYKVSQWHYVNDSLPTSEKGVDKVAVELFEFDNLGHGIMVNSLEEHGGKPADFLLSAPISTVTNVIDFWRIL